MHNLQLQNKTVSRRGATLLAAATAVLTMAGNDAERALPPAAVRAATHDVSPVTPSKKPRLTTERPRLTPERIAERRRRDAFVVLAAGIGTGPLADQVLSRLPYGAEISSAATSYGLDGLLIAAIVAVESSFDPEAISHQGAIGLMQVMPSTAPNWAIEELGDPSTNLRAGSAYFGKLLARFDHDLPLALAAYNAGPSAVVRFGGIPPFRETQSFVRKVLSEYQALHEATLEQPDLVVAAGS